ncbi:ArfGAP with FG repeats 1 [Actinomortierella wolfii]|nr:ArfGAP with FG repeats 1 [Actinomortierella wolfii]
MALRELNHRVKSISASTFTPEEIAALQKGGNGVAKTIWLATWSRQEYPEPDSNDNDEVRQFMRAKYVKKLWHIDNTSTSAPAQQQSSNVDSTSRPSNASPSSTQTSPSTVRSNAPINPNIALAKAASAGLGPGQAPGGTSMPERTLSRKSSSLSTDSGSTSLSKSTDPSSAGSSPFHPASGGVTKQSLTSQHQFPSSNLGQYSFNQFQQSFASAPAPTNHTALTTNTDDSDPFSLMQASFSNMHVSGTNQQQQLSVPTRSFTAPAPSGNHSTFTDFESAFSTPASQQPPVPAMSTSSNDFFAAFHQTSSSSNTNTQASTTSIPRGSSSATSAFGSALQGQHASSPMVASPGALSPMASMHTPQASASDYFGSGTGSGTNRNHVPTMGASLGVGSFDDVFSSKGPAHTSSSSSSLSSDALNPFGLREQSFDGNTSLTPVPPALQRAHTSAYPSTTGSSTNPFAAFAKSSSAAASSAAASTHVDLQDPFGHMTRGMSASSSLSPSSSSPFMMNGGGAGSGSGLSTPKPYGVSSPNPFSTVGGSTAATSGNFMNEYPFGIPASTTGTSSSLSSSSAAFFTATSTSSTMPPMLSRATTEPTVSHFATGSYGTASSSTSHAKVEDVFGTWATKNTTSTTMGAGTNPMMSPTSPSSSVSASAFGLKDFDPFGNHHHHHASSASTQQPISTNPFGL